MEGDLAALRPYLLARARYFLRGFEEDLVQETLLYLWEERAYYLGEGEVDLRRWGVRHMRSMRDTLVDLHRLRERA